MIEIKDIPRLIDNEENRVRRIAKYLKENPDSAFTEEELQKATGIQCISSLLNYSRHDDIIKRLNMKHVSIIRKGEFSCGSDRHWYYQSPEKKKKKGFWSFLRSD